MCQLVNANRSVFWKMVLLLIVAGVAVFLVSPVFADTMTPLAGKGVVTIAASGSQAYYLGEEIVFSGVNSDSDSTYLFITGPNLPDGGGKLSSPSQNPVSGDPGSFTLAKTNPDNTWEYAFYTANLKSDAGSYTLYAVSQPKTKDQFTDVTTYGTTSIIIKRPYITAEISPSSVSKGMPMTVSGVAEGIPPDIQVWIFGKNYYSKSIEPVNPDASYKYVVPREVTSTLAAGQVLRDCPAPDAEQPVRHRCERGLRPQPEHEQRHEPFQDLPPGSLQGSDAAEALITAISMQEAHDATYTNDTYTIIPFQVTDAGNQAPQQPTRDAPLVFAPVGAIVLVFGIAVWKRR